MKANSIILGLTACTLALSSCSMFKTVAYKADDTAAKTATTTQATTTQATTTQATTTMPAKPVNVPKDVTAAKDKTKKGNSKKNKGQSETGSTKTISNGTKLTVAENIAGPKWDITQVNGMAVTADEDTPYIQFAKDGRFYASDGCNIINGDYNLSREDALSFANVMSTMKFCPEAELSSIIAQSLSGASAFNAECRKIGGETYLYLKANAKNVLTLRRHNMEFLNGNWQIIAIDGKHIDDEEANIFIDIAELKIHGNTGCNYFNGELFINPDRSNAIDFSNIVVTRMMCPKIDRERAMLVALEETVTAIAGKNDNTVLLLNSKGKEVLMLKRIDVPAMNN